MLYPEAKRAIRTGSKSFSLASIFLEESSRAGAYLLYRWCRHCDDAIDEAQEEVSSLRSQTLAAYEPNAVLAPAFASFREVARAYSIPQDYALDLLDGMEMDRRGQTYETLGDLRLYCYRVAGTVGLMMSHVLGVSSPRALEHAVELGIAMQLTNIARDVLEDLERGRIYLPLAWLREAGVDPSSLRTESFRDPELRGKVHAVVMRLLDAADRSYRLGYEGLDYLPLRAAVAIRAAGELYSGIGHELLRRGPSALERRTVLPRWRKALIVARSAARALPFAPRRLSRPWNRAPLTEVWRFRRSE